MFFELNPLTQKLDMLRKEHDYLSEEDILEVVKDIDCEDVENPLLMAEITADEIEAICSSDTTEKPDETTIVEEIVSLGSGTYNEDKLANVWYFGNGKFRITQTKGYGTTAVNDDYLAQPRVYKGHILEFEALLENVSILSVEIKYNGNYMGNTMVAGIEVDSAKNVIECPDILKTIWSTSSNDCHTITSLLDSGLKLIYVQNSATETVVQLRITNIVVKYQVL